MSIRATGATGFTITWIVLLCLTALSFGMSFVSLGAFSTPVAIGIAAVKGSLVVAIFMELIESRASLRFTALAGVLMLILLASLLSVDVLTRAAAPLVPPAIHR